MSSRSTFRARFHCYSTCITNKFINSSEQLQLLTPDIRLDRELMKTQCLRSSPLDGELKILLGVDTVDSICVDQTTETEVSNFNCTVFTDPTARSSYVPLFQREGGERRKRREREYWSIALWQFVQDKNMKCYEASNYCI